MRRNERLLTTVLALATGCNVFDGTERAKPLPPDAAPILPDATPPIADAAPAGTTSVLFTLPTDDPFYGRGIVTLQLYVTGPDPDRLELWRNGSPLAVLEPPYTYLWNTDPEQEGSYLFEARAVNGGTIVSTDTQMVVVDREGPVIVSTDPAFSADARPSTPLVVTFSEPMDIDRLHDGSIYVLSGGAGPLPLPQPFTATWSDGNRVLTIQIDAPGPTTPADGRYYATDLYDLAGNPLTYEHPEYGPILGLLNFPIWLVTHEGTTLPPDAVKIDSRMAADGTLWLLYGVPPLPGAGDGTLNVARWTGTDWDIPTPPLATTPMWASSRLILDAAGNPVVGVFQQSIYAFLGGAWVIYPEIPPPDGIPSYFETDWDLVAAPDGDLLLARAYDGTVYEVWKGGASGWTLQDPLPTPPSFTYYPRVALLPTDGGYVIAYASGSSAYVSERTSLGWIEYGNLVWYDLWVNSLSLELGGDGMRYFGASYNVGYGYPTGTVLRFDGVYWLSPGISGSGGVWGLDPSPTGIYVVVGWGATTVVLDATGFVADFTSSSLNHGIRRVMTDGGVPLLLDRWGNPGEGYPSQFLSRNSY